MEDSCDSQSARQSTSTTGPFWVAALLQIVSPFVLIPFGLSISKFASDSGNQFGGEIVNSESVDARSQLGPLCACDIGPIGNLKFN